MWRNVAKCGIFYESSSFGGGRTVVRDSPERTLLAEPAVTAGQRNGVEKGPVAVRLFRFSWLPPETVAQGGNYTTRPDAATAAKCGSQTRGAGLATARPPGTASSGH
jgi:hypothetical protein